MAHKVNPADGIAITSPMAHKVANDILIPEIARLVDAGREVMFTPSGVSMRPFIEGGRDSVLLRKPEQVRVGDIVLARFGTIYVLHRVYRILPSPSSSSAASSSASGTSSSSPAASSSVSDSSSIVLMGDGNLRGEEHIRPEDVLATVAEIRSPHGHRKPRTRGIIWRHLLRQRWLLLKFYRKLILPLFY